VNAPRTTLTESVRARLFKVAGACPACKGPGILDVVDAVEAELRKLWRAARAIAREARP